MKTIKEEVEKYSNMESCKKYKCEMENEIKKNLEMINAKYKKLSNLKMFEINYDRFKNTKIYIDAEKNKKNKYEKNKETILKIRKSIDEFNEFDKMKIIYNDVIKYENWLNKKNEMIEKMKQLKIKKKNLCDVEKKEYDEQCKYKKEIHYEITKKEIFNIMNDIKNCESQIAIKKDIDNLYEMINRINKYEKIKNDELFELENLINYHDTENKNMYSLHLLFNNYRFWFFSKLIPKLLNKINNLISKILNSEEMKINASVNKKIKKNKEEIRIDWFIKIGSDEIIINKASCFQKFILGIASRITMTTSGTSSILCKQLFIDEGFTSADAENLEKMPKFIMNLQNIYDSVLLVSHLDVIKESSTIKINITRKKYLSYLQFGEEKNIIEMKNKSGRPKKIEKK